jgi:hypothetical protein
MSVFIFFGFFGLIYPCFLDTLRRDKKRSLVALAEPCGCATHKERLVVLTKREGFPPPQLTHWPGWSLICPDMTALWVAAFHKSIFGRYFIFFGLVWFDAATEPKARRGNYLQG